MTHPLSNLHNMNPTRVSIKWSEDWMNSIIKPKITKLIRKSLTVTMSLKKVREGGPHVSQPYLRPKEQVAINHPLIPTITVVEHHQPSHYPPTTNFLTPCTPTSLNPPWPLAIKPPRSHYLRDSRPSPPNQNQPLNNSDNLTNHRPLPTTSHRHNPNPHQSVSSAEMKNSLTSWKESNYTWLKINTRGGLPRHRLTFFFITTLSLLKTSFRTIKSRELISRWEYKANLPNRSNRLTCTRSQWAVVELQWALDLNLSLHLNHKNHPVDLKDLRSTT